MPDKNWNQAYFATITGAHWELRSLLTIEALKGKAFISLEEGDYKQACEWLEKALDKLAEIGKMNTDEYSLTLTLLAVVQRMDGNKEAARKSVDTAMQQAKSPEMWDMLHNMPL